MVGKSQAYAIGENNSVRQNLCPIEKLDKYVKTYGQPSSCQGIYYKPELKNTVVYISVAFISGLE
jgi:hypothetical protein